MRSGFFFMPFSFGLVELILIGVVIVLILKAVTGDKRGGKVIAGILVAIGAVLVVPGLFLGLMFVSRSFQPTPVIVHNYDPHAAIVAATDQAKLASEHARLQTEQMAAEIQAKTQAIRQRTSVMMDDMVPPPMPAGHSVVSTPGVTEVFGDQQMLYEDPGTGVAQVVSPVIVEAPSVVDTYEDPVTERVDSVQVVVAETPVETHSGITVAGTPWTDAIEEHQDFEADIYPSMEDAAEALGRRVGQRLMQDLGDSEAEGADAPYVYVWRDTDVQPYIYLEGESDSNSNAGIASRDVLEAVARGLKQKMFDPAYVSVERPVNGTSVLVAIQELRFENHNRWRKQAKTKAGGLALRVKTTDDAFAVSTRFTDKPWLVDRSSFTHDFDNTPWLVAYSDSTHTAQNEAYWDALHKAADAVLPMAKARISQLSGADQQRFHQQMNKDSNWLRDRVADELVSRNLVTDQFTQQYDRPYGPVWREAVLVNATPSSIEEIARSLVQGINFQVQHKRTTLFSYIALAVLVIGTYIFLNIASKGYYAWSLRLALMVGLGVVVFLFMSMA